MSDLSTLIKIYSDAKSTWEIADRRDDTKCHGPEWDAFIAAETVLVCHPCRTIGEVRAKAALFRENDSLYDTLRRCYTNDQESLALFLESLLGETDQVEGGANV